MHGISVCLAFLAGLEGILAVGPPSIKTEIWQVQPGLPPHGPPDLGPGPFGPIGPGGGGSWGGPGGGWDGGIGFGHHGHHGHHSHSHSHEWDSHEGGRGNGHGGNRPGRPGRPGRPNRPNKGNNNWNNNGNGNGNFNKNDWGWFNQHLSQLQRLYSPKHDRHRFHTENQPISTFLSEGFHHEAPQGRMITVGRFNQHMGEIRRRCPHMVPLYAALNARGNTQRLTTNQFELNSLTASGWYAIQQVGYCVNSRNCGAKKALRQLSVTAKLADIVYTTDDNEFNFLNNVRKEYRGSGTGPICYLW